ncbi:hypothetical protein CRENBAI_006390 [Crenichthys baileyi]|uniref:Uncharacterized protein n=1 Tax=Crenichthys baileyi TaxID=28760 RepID=A0AAV9RAD1_9TELE
MNASLTPPPNRKCFYLAHTQQRACEKLWRQLEIQLSKWIKGVRQAYYEAKRHWINNMTVVWMPNMPQNHRCKNVFHHLKSHPLQNEDHCKLRMSASPHTPKKTLNKPAVTQMTLAASFAKGIPFDRGGGNHRGSDKICHQRHDSCHRGGKTRVQKS